MRPRAAGMAAVMAAAITTATTTAITFISGITATSQQRHFFTRFTPCVVWTRQGSWYQTCLSAVCTAG